MRQLIEATHEQDGGASWGVATGTRPVPELATSYAEAQRALEIGRALEGPGRVADAAALAP